ncbi:MAG: DUF1801 domain-containing protein [Actinobacteria bacterium]|nr:DUF1801 domain-containing protein [Actinomycetota bacterium]
MRQLTLPTERGDRVTAPSTVEDYLSGVPEEARAALENLRKTIKAAAPDTTETISYQMPTFKYRGRPLVGFAAFKNHCSFFPYSGRLIEAHKKELASYETSKGTIRFSADNALPTPLVEKFVKARIQEIEARHK